MINICKSPLDTAYNRLDEAHRSWHNALSGYHKINDFRAGINSAIQALRNLTFAIQKQKDNLPNFDNWYAGWQSKMKNDPILKELHDARNIIVKEEDLILYSTAKATTKGWMDFEKTAFTFDPLQDSYTVAKDFYDTYAKYLPIAEDLKKRLIFEFERKWVYEKIPDYELLDAISHSYNFLYEILKDAEEKFSLPIKENNSTGDYCTNELNDKNKLKCMIITSQERCLKFSFENGASLEMKTEKILLKESDLDVAHKRYGDKWKSDETLALLEGLFADEYPFNQMKLFSQVAVAALKKDKHLIPVSFLFKINDKRPMIISGEFQNQEHKIMVMDNIASEIVKNNIKFVLTIAEIWRYDYDEKNPHFFPTGEQSGRAKEAIEIACLSTNKIKLIAIPFKKNIFGKIIYSKPEVIKESSTDNYPPSIFSPIINALRSN